MTAENFMTSSRIISGSLVWSSVIFCVGPGRSGDIHTLRHLGEGLGYEVDVVQPALVNDQMISSTRIRELVSQGQVVMPQPY